MILAGDVGGTKTLLGLFTWLNGRPHPVREAAYPSQESPSLEAIIEKFLAEGSQTVHRCAVGVAGPVVEGKSHVVNLRWPVAEKTLARALGTPNVRVLNDLEATAWGIPVLPASKLVNLTPGLRPRRGNAALIAAGTGLGTALLFWDGEKHVPSAGEGGHQSFAPRDDLEIDLLRYLRERLDRVSVERIVAGPGFSVIYQFLIDSGRGKESPLMTRRLAEGDPNAAVSEAGVTGDDPVAERAVDIFVSLYGAVAGDLALVGRATGGVFVGGGIAPKILAKLRMGKFLESFRSKGRLSPLLEAIPVKVIVEPRTALLGAAAAAASIPVSLSRTKRARRRGKR
ncbi:MAG: glucokinase [Acidobacteriota bacterium]|nr:glucokinase [Acidobacteriota bacterium]